MTPDEAFLQAIRESQDDDAPRLIYADWLEEHGDSERAEFIRLQCELARMNLYDERRPELENREKDLLAKRDAEWSAPLKELGLSRYHYRRGFVEKVELHNDDQFMSLRDELFRRAPLVQHLSLSVYGRDSTGIRTPYLRRLTSLELQGGSAAVPVVLAAPQLSHLRALHFRHGGRNRLNDQDVEALAACPHLSNLEDLSLRGQNVGVRGVQALASFPHLSGLDLADNPIEDAGAEVLAASPHLSRLTSLDLSEARIGNSGVRALAASPHLSQLTRLGLACNLHLTAKGAEALAESRWLTGLTSLHLGGSPQDTVSKRRGIGMGGARALAASPNMAGLTFLSLGWDNVADTGAKALSASPHLSRLRELDLRFNRIGESGLEALIASPHLLGLRALGLGGNPAGPREEYCYDPYEDWAKPWVFDQVAAAGVQARFRQRPYIYGFDGPIGWWKARGV